MNSSIGIIGGADGPTAVFVITHSVWFDIMCIAVAAVIAVAVVAVFYLVSKKRRH